MHWGWEVQLKSITIWIFTQVNSKSPFFTVIVSSPLFLRIVKFDNTYFHTIAFSDALYFAFPFKQINCTPDVFKGVGIFTSIFCPNNEGLKFDFRTTFTSILVRPTSRTNGITRKGREMSFVVRYLKDGILYLIDI